MLARETQFCWSRLAAKRYWWMRAGCHAGRIQNWILAKMWFHPIEGDAERPTEQRLIEKHPEADLLKVAHHGSATSTRADLLAAVHPKFAVISVGAQNVYGHPRHEVLSRLQESNIKTYRTDLDGAVSFYLDGKVVSPRVASLR